MVKSQHTPSRPHMAQRVIALALLASFSACSLGGEPRHSAAKEEQERSARATDPFHAPAHEGTSNRSKHGVIRTSEPVPEPKLARSDPDATPVQDETVAPTSQPRATAPRDTDAALEALPATQLPHVADENGPPPGPAIAPTQASSLPRSAASPTSPPPPPAPEHHETSYWPAYLGAGIAALSILALAMLRRRDRRASQLKRDTDLALAEERERTAAAAREEALRLEEQRAAQAAAEAAAAERAAEQAAEQARAQAIVAAAREKAQSKPDPRIEAAHRLFDLLHRAERDVEPFLEMLDEAAPHDVTTSASRQVVASWHESMLSTRNRLSEVLARHNASADMHVVEPAGDLASAMSRLIDHAARMSALMVAQQQENSAILHWSRQLPGALIQLFWRAQTARYTSTLPQLPRVPDAPAPGAVASVEPAATLPPARVRDKAIQQALRGGQGHAVST